ncbi:hypothetical protein STEG23_022496 [Scotinomys teguina]
MHYSLEMEGTSLIRILKQEDKINKTLKRILLSRKEKNSHVGKPDFRATFNGFPFWRDGGKGGPTFLQEQNVDKWKRVHNIVPVKLTLVKNE